MERELKRQQRTIGAILEIPLENGFKTYARILDTFIAFYDIYTEEKPEIEEIIDSEVLFITTVYDYVITKGYWLKIGKGLPLEKNLLTIPPFYTQDFLNQSRYHIYDNNGKRLATKEECLGLESFTVWEHAIMEKRLNDHFTDQPNEYVEKMLKAGMYSEPKVIPNAISTEWDEMPIALKKEIEEGWEQSENGAFRNHGFVMKKHTKWL